MASQIPRRDSNVKKIRHGSLSSWLVLCTTPIQKFASSNNSNTLDIIESWLVYNKLSVTNLTAFYTPAKAKVTWQRMRKDSNRRWRDEPLVSPWKRSGEKKKNQIPNITRILKICWDEGWNNKFGGESKFIIFKN